MVIEGCLVCGQERSAGKSGCVVELPQGGPDLLAGEPVPFAGLDERATSAVKFLGSFVLSLMGGPDLLELPRGECVPFAVRLLLRFGGVLACLLAAPCLLGFPGCCCRCRLSLGAGVSRSLAVPGPWPAWLRRAP